MPPSSPTLVDYLTLAAALVAAAGPIVKLWEIFSKDRERIDLHIEWNIIDSGGEIDNEPFLFLHNKSSNAILITDIRFITGLFIRRKKRYTALYSEDYSDINFPYEIEPGERRRFMLSSETGCSYYKYIGWRTYLSKFFKRSWLWLGIDTASGTSKMIGAEEVIPWVVRPQWTKIKED